jgi:bifunctional non-homologous end joining protein LigD
LAALYDGLQKIKHTTCLFVNLPETNPGRRGLGVTAAVMKRCHWVEPLLIAQVKFTEMDEQRPDASTRLSDKDPKHVVGEQAAVFQ